MRETVPNRIREWRQLRGLSQSALARLVNCSNQQISFLETGELRLSVDWMRRLGAVLDCSPTDLMAPADVGPIGKLPRHVKAIVEAVSGLDSTEQAAVRAAVEATVKAIKSRKKPRLR